MEGNASRGRAPGGRGRGRGRGRHNPENPRQNQNAWQSSGPNRQWGDAGGARSGSQRGGTNYGSQRPNWPQDRRPIEGSGPQFAPSRAAPMSYASATVWQSRGRDGRGGMVQQMVRQPGSDPQSSTPVVAPAPPSLELHSMKISESQADSMKIVPIKRPDEGGRFGIRSLQLFVNHFRVKFDHQLPIRHYDLDIQPVTPHKRNTTGKISKSDSLLVKNQLFADYPTVFPNSKTCYDGEKNLYSAVELHEGKYPVIVSKGDDVRSREYTVSVKLVKVLDLSRLVDYLNRKEMVRPREILQAMDVIIGENPRLTRIAVGAHFFKKGVDKDLGGGIIASTGFRQSLKPTALGLSLCVDYSVISFRKQVPVLDFLREHLDIQIFRNTSWDDNLKGYVKDVLKGLKVTVNHRRTSQKYIIGELTTDNTRNLRFEIDSPDGMDSRRTVGIVEYFQEKYDKMVVYQGLPCLDLSKKGRPNYVPMEFCELVEGQRFPKENLPKGAARDLKDMALIKPHVRRKEICSLIGASDGPCGGEIADEFHLTVSKEMTIVTGRVLEQPALKLRDSSGQCCHLTPPENGQWNFNRNQVFDGKEIDRWAILDFTASCRGRFKLDKDRFTQAITERANRIGIRMNPQWLHYKPSGMSVLNDERRLCKELKEVYNRTGGKLQLLFCPMEKRHPGYNPLKRICETEIGIVTQCFLSFLANEDQDQYFVNLALKFNAKLGGSNMELFRILPGLGDDCHVMFMGADVNHPSSKSLSNKSIAAVTASMNWPGANRYAVRIRAQPRRMERILQIGDMCLSLIEAYARNNGIKPQKIIFFRDGVSDGQFDMVLNEELQDIKKAIESECYKPTITLVVAQKRHQTRFFPQNPRDGGKSGNIPPGTVVDTGIITPQEFDFFLSSHYGSLGTSKPTHYHCLWDEHCFSSDQLQTIIYNLCYTFPRCTKPVSLVPPVACADLAAFRGRQYDESGMHPSPSTSASSPSSSSSSSLASLDIRDFPKVHPDLENLMIFI